MADFDKKALEIAVVANECCYRSDGYEENIQARIATALKEAYNDGAREIAAELSRWWPEDREQIEGIVRSKKALP